jgi:septation ring formation regulator EzrA
MISFSELEKLLENDLDEVEPELRQFSERKPVGKVHIIVN